MKAHAAKEDSSSESAVVAINTHRPKHEAKLLASLKDRLEDGYMSYAACEPEHEKVSIAWNNATSCKLQPITDADTHLQVEGEHATISTMEGPFCFDTRAMSHISPNKADFTDLKPITPKNICGVDGASIPAIAIGLVKIRCGKGRKFTLKDTLYAPQAALHLISVGRLGDEGCTTIFEAKQCRVLRNDKVLAQRTREDRNLYKLQGSAHTMEHANIACATPSLKTWHRPLGHVNYATVIEMAKNGSVTGMHTNLSTLPPMC